MTAGDKDVFVHAVGRTYGSAGDKTSALANDLTKSRIHEGFGTIAFPTFTPPPRQKPGEKTTNASLRDPFLAAKQSQSCRGLGASLDTHMDAYHPHFWGFRNHAKDGTRCDGDAEVASCVTFGTRCDLPDAGGNMKFYHFALAFSMRPCCPFSDGCDAEMVVDPGWYENIQRTVCGPKKNGLIYSDG